ncbi:MAG TPA: M23 family metallopeptidase [Bryobacteraceae bacterium]|nr:M23 family metallopeptidase [Bryobacteraceae bacterium]
MRGLKYLAAALLASAALVGAAQTAGNDCEINPGAVPQGEVVRVSCSGMQSARMNGRTIQLFPQSDGRPLGLMPVRVLEKPGDYPLELLDANGAVVRTLTVHVLNAHYPKQNVNMESSTAALKPSPGEQETVTAFRDTASPERYWTDTLQLPVKGCLTSRFGVQRFVNGKPTGDFHGGLDQRGAAGTPIHAIAGGVVKIVHDFNLRGGTVAIDHGQGVESIYMHMSKTAASEGAHVEAGEVIGYIGATGRANGPHLHWTLYVNGVIVNPVQWVKVPPSCYATHTTAAAHPHHS